MAKQVSQENVTKLHNVKATTKAFQDYATEALQVRVERRKLSDRMKVARKSAKEAGVDTEVADLTVRVRERKIEAQAHFKDQLELGFEALAIGERSDIFPSDDEQLH